MMWKLCSCAAVLALVAVAIGQEQQLSLPQKNPTVLKSLKANTPLVVFVNQKIKPVTGALSMEVMLEGPARVIVLTPDGRGWFSALKVKEPTPENVHIAIQEGREALVQPPFDGSPGRPTADGSADAAGPWLPQAEQERLAKLLPKEVKLGRGWFYQLAPRYQNLFTMNSIPYMQVDTLHDEHPEMTVSGGMLGHSFKSVKRIEVPQGKKIVVWKQSVDVRAFAPTPLIRWSFPEGTRALDILLNNDGQVFEVRQQVKGDSDWETSIPFRDKTKFPVGYNGLERSCASCHSTTATIHDVPGRIYRRVRWGDDGRFSWRPFDESGNIDHRWPIEVR